MKHQPSPSRNGPDRWLLSYADFVTLLFALFAVLYGISTVDATKIAPVASSLQQAFALNQTAVAPPPPVVVQPPALGVHEVPIESTHRRLTREFAAAVAAKQIEILDDTRGVVLSLPEAVTFAIGSAEVTPEARDLIAQLGATLATLEHHIAVEGHTDDVPIHTARYQSNWELSTSRACAVVALLIEVAGIDPARLAAAGYAEYHGRAPNDSAANRARNRRVDIVVRDEARRDAVEGAEP